MDYGHGASMNNTKPRIAIVPDSLNQRGGAERVVAVLHTMFPDAPIYTSIMDPDELWPELIGADIRTSWMQKLPGLKKHFKKYLMLYPKAFESLDLSDYDIVISISSAFSKGVKTRKGAVHICYCCTPMRFVWDYDNYVKRERFGKAIRLALPFFISLLKKWDIETINRPHEYVAISSVVANRIKQYYGKEASIIFPPVNVDRFLCDNPDGDYYLVVSRLNPYKRIDLAVSAFNELGLPLVIAGDGHDRPVLESMAKSNIHFTGRVTDEQLKQYYGSCRALIFTGIEDFGIIPLEANAAGRPVIAYKAGGVLDTIVEGINGVFFSSQTPDSIIDAVHRQQHISWDKQKIQAHASKFSVSNFKREFIEFVEKVTQQKIY
jgi:glycosyltransferase involved in cell wall biosynthesis